MRLPRFDYVEPKTLREAVRMLDRDTGSSVLLAGGTDLLVQMKQWILQPGRVINLKTIPHLAYIKDAKDGLRVGTLTTLHDLSVSPIVLAKVPALAEASREVGAYAHQVMGTLGGNLCQTNRCRFYNQSRFWRSTRPPCYKAGGMECYVVPVRREEGQRRLTCYSTYCGDLAPVLIALDSKLRIVGPGGERILPLKKLYTQNGKNPLSLKKGEVIREAFIPSPSGKTLYLKSRLRDSIEFPTVSLAISLDRRGDGKIEKAKVVLSGVGQGPVEALETEKLLKGKMIDRSLVEKASEQVAKETSPVRTSLVSPSYKRKMAGILLSEALSRIETMP